MLAAQTDRLDSYVLKLAKPEDPRPGDLIVGQTSYQDVYSHYLIIDEIGSSYTGGPVLSLSEWELGVDGIHDLRLSFNSNGLLDVITVTAAGIYFDAIVSILEEAYPVDFDAGSEKGFRSLNFTADGYVLMIDDEPMNERMTISLVTDDFMNAKMAAQKRYA